MSISMVKQQNRLCIQPLIFVVFFSCAFFSESYTIQYVEGEKELKKVTQELNDKKLLIR